MKLSDISIKNPVFAWMLMAALILFGYVGFHGMGISSLPDVDFPIVTVTTTWEGAAPEVMETEVVDVVEDAVMQVQGVKEVDSTSKQGSATISIEFELNRDIDAALQEVQTKIAQAQKNLPKDMDPVIITKTNPEDNPIMWLALSGDIPLPQMMRYTKDQLKDKFTTVPGVGEVVLGGYVEPNLRVWLDADKMESRELTVSDLMNAVTAQHSEVPAGFLDTGTQEMNVRVMGEAATVKEFENIIIPDRAGAPIWRKFRIGDVATVEDSLDDIRRISRVNGQPAIGLGIKKQRGSNAVAVARAVKQRMKEVEAELPAGLKIGVNFDSTKFIERSTNDLSHELLLAGLLTAVVCWLFLGSWTAAINIIFAIPTSIMGAFLILYFFGFTLNTFTLLGLTLVIGIVVDDAIMVLENIMRHREMGEPKVHAAIVGAREITSAATAASIAILAIFVPVVFMPGIMGKFFFQFGITISAAVSLSLLEALTLAPMRCSQFLQINHDSWYVRKKDIFLDGLSHSYKWSLGWIMREWNRDDRRFLSVLAFLLAGLLAVLACVALNAGVLAAVALGIDKIQHHFSGASYFKKIFHAFVALAAMTLAVGWASSRAGNGPRLATALACFYERQMALYRLLQRRHMFVLLLSVLCFASSLRLAQKLKSEFVPPQDQGNMFIQVQTAPGSSIEFTDNVFRGVEKVVSVRPEVTRYYAAIGGFGGGDVNTGIMFVTLKDKKDRPVDPKAGHRLSQQELMPIVRKDVAAVPGVTRAVIQDLSLSGFSAKRGFPVEFTLLGSDWDKMGDLSEQLMKKMTDSGFMTDVDSNYLLGQPEVRVTPDRTKAASRGVSVTEIGNTINATIGGIRVGKYTQGGRRYDIRIRLIEKDRKAPTDINKIWVRNNRGEVIRLGEVVDIVQRKTLVSVSRVNRERAINIYSNVAPGKSQSEALQEVQRIAKQFLPNGYRIQFSGSARTFQESFQALGMALLLGIIVAYMVLGSQFNSFIHPIVVLSALPFSITGAFIALYLGHKSINMYSMIGVILLMGIVKKNSILLVDFTNERRKAGLGVRDALLEACPIRLRPIIMTSLATISAAVPTAIGLGAGSETRIPMALVIIGGVTVSTVLTLFVVPSLYLFLSRFESSAHAEDLREALIELGELPASARTNGHGAVDGESAPATPSPEKIPN